MLSGVAVVITGLRAVCTGAEPYADPRDPKPGARRQCHRIEQRKKGSWVRLAGPRADATTDTVLPPRS